MSIVPGTRLTPEEYLALPEEPPYLEYLNGEVRAKAMPGPVHSRLVARLLLRMGIHLEQQRGLLLDTELRHYNEAEHRYFLPDVSVTRRSRQPNPLATPVVVMPDVAIEVLSPTDRPGDVLDKVSFYLRNGVEVVWVVDATVETVHVFQRGEPPVVVRGEDVLTAAPILDGFALPADELFAVLHDDEPADDSAGE